MQMDFRTVKTYSRKRKLITYLEDSQNDFEDTVAASSLPSPPLSSSPAEPHKQVSSSLNSPIHQYLQASPLSFAQQKPVKKLRRFTQLTIDLGVGSVHKRCPTCGMEYVPSNSEDVKTHKDFHMASVGGIQVPSGLTPKWRVKKKGSKRPSTTTPAQKIKSGEHHVDTIVEIDQSDALCVKKYARRVLEYAEQELGAVQREHELWSPGSAQTSKVYLFIHNGKCTGLCLAERIKSAFPVQAPGETAWLENSSSISTSSTPLPAILGISRIWVAREFRRTGIACDLLDVARREFVYGMKIAKNKIAFSQPTDSGARLARAWFGMTQGWLVYQGHT